MTQKDTVAAPPSRWLRVALVVSLTINLLIVGLAVGASVKWRRDGPPASFDLNVGPLGRALSHEDRRAIGEALRDRRDARLPNRDQRVAEAAALAAALRAQPFDPDGFMALLESQQSRGRDLQLAAQSALVARIARLTPEERNAFADRIEAGLASRDREPPRRD